MIPLEHGDRVVAVTNFRDYVLVVTERGVIFKLTHDDTYQLFVTKL